MKRRILIALSTLAVLGMGVYFVLAPGQAPEGQPSLVTMNYAALEDLKAEFNRASDSARIILLLSPT